MTANRAIRVLVADDATPVRTAVCAMLGAIDGIEVVGGVADGQEAVVEARRLEPDVIVMDMRMPVLDGLAASRAIRQERPATRIVMLTAYTDPSIEEAAAEIGIERFLRKGSPAAELVEAIRSSASAV